MDHKVIHNLHFNLVKMLIMDFKIQINMDKLHLQLENLYLIIQHLIIMEMIFKNIFKVLIMIYLNKIYIVYNHSLQIKYNNNNY